MMRAAWDGKAKPQKTARCLAWRNTIILKAPNREKAYKKALALAAKNCGNFWDPSNPSRKGRWVVEGLSNLLPIYEKLGDGAEISWEEYENTTISRVRTLTRNKQDLECFDDTPAIGDKAG